MSGVRIGLWGASSSGKSSFLAALGLSTMTRETMKGDWKVFGADDTSTNFLIASTNSLENRKQFPPPTQSATTYDFSLKGSVQRVQQQNPTMLDRFKGKPAQSVVDEEMAFSLTFVDVPGESFDVKDLEDADDPKRLDEVLEEFDHCQALLFLYDPEENSTNFDVFYPLVFALSSKLDRENRLVNGKLPHFLAMCVTKFDHPDVYLKARDNNIEMVQDPQPPHFPVPKDPEAFFQLMSRGDSKLKDGMNRYFHSDRIRYFATSAVGFRKVDGIFDPDDFLNTRPGIDGSVATIIGDPHPINILEPLVELGKLARRTAAPGGKL